MLPKSIKNLPAIALSLACSAASQASAAVIFSEDLESHPLGLFAGNEWDTAPTDSYEVTTDTADLFGQGTSNKILSIYSQTVDGGEIGTYQDITNYNAQTSTISFDLIQQPGAEFLVTPGTEGATALTKFATLKFLGGAIEIKSGIIPNLAYTADGQTPVHFDLVINNTDSAQAYESTSVAARSLDLWIDGVEVASDIPAEKTIAQLSSLKVHRRLSSGDNLLDNLVITDTLQPTSIPEPATFVLTLLGAVCLFNQRKQK